VTHLADALEGTVPAAETAEPMVRHEAGPLTAFE
jgi:hypothetical protein